MFNYNNNSGYGYNPYNPYYQREEPLNIPIDNKNRVIIISKIFYPNNTNPEYKFILKTTNGGKIMSPNFYSDPEQFMNAIEYFNSNAKEITIPFTFDLELCFVKLYFNMQKYRSHLSAYKKLMEGKNVKSISYQFSILNGIISDTAIILQFYDDIQENRLPMFDHDNRFSIEPYHNPLKKVINQCMEIINNPPKTKPKTKKRNTTKKKGEK